MLKSIRMFALSATASLVTAAPCAAQFVPYAEVSAGYNFMRFQQESAGQNMNQGAYADLAINLNSGVGIVGMVSGNSVAAASDVRLLTAMGGLRFSARGYSRGPGHGVGFFHLMGGLLGNKVGANSYFDRAMDIGGGANISFTNQAAVRLQADYIRTFSQQNVTLGDNYFRLAVGLVYGIGSQ